MHMEKVKEEQLSEKEVAAIVIPEVENSKKDKLKKIIVATKNFLFKDWKKDLKKIQFLLVVIFYAAIVLGIVSFFTGNLFGWKTDVFINKVSYKTYSHIAPNFSFKYPSYFGVDNGEGKNYGTSYLAGLKLDSDSRTGCDIRLNGAGLNFKKSDDEIKKALIAEVSKGAKDFNLLNAKRIKVNGEDAFSLEFAFTDPIGGKVRLNQILTGHNNNFYLFICGTGEYQYKYFEKDFQSFIDSFKWN